MGEKVSVIVPIYNCAEWLEQCLRSITEQSYNELEIILIDDGSKDSSLSICRSFSGKDARIKVVHQENAGVSAARNCGIRLASGKFLMFVDADDYLAMNIIDAAVNEIIDEETSLVIWNCCKFIRTGKVRCKELTGKVENPNALCTAIIAGYHEGFFAGETVRAPWGKLYRTDIIQNNKIYFPEKMYYCEDAIFLLNYLGYCKDIKLINLYGSFYRILETSLCHKYKDDILQQALLEYDEIQCLYPKYGVEKKERNAICSSAWARLYEIYKNSLIGYDEHLIPLKDISVDAESWYESVLRKMTDCDRRGAAAMTNGKLTNIQILMGAEWPFAVHGKLMQMHYEVSGVINKIRGGHKLVFLLGCDFWPGYMSAAYEAAA